jgi:hypothetical protein
MEEEELTTPDTPEDVESRQVSEESRNVIVYKVVEASLAPFTFVEEVSKKVAFFGVKELVKLHLVTCVLLTILLIGNLVTSMLFGTVTLNKGFVPLLDVFLALIIAASMMYVLSKKEAASYLAEEQEVEEVSELLLEQEEELPEELMSQISEEEYVVEEPEQKEDTLYIPLDDENEEDTLPILVRPLSPPTVPEMIDLGEEVDFSDDDFSTESLLSALRGDDMRSIDQLLGALQEENNKFVSQDSVELLFKTNKLVEGENL